MHCSKYQCLSLNTVEVNFRVNSQHFCEKLDLIQFQHLFIYVWTDSWSFIFLESSNNYDKLCITKFAKMGRRIKSCTTIGNTSENQRYSRLVLNWFFRYRLIYPKICNTTHLLTENIETMQCHIMNLKVILSQLTFVKSSSQFRLFSGSNRNFYFHFIFLVWCRISLLITLISTLH